MLEQDLHIHTTWSTGDSSVVPEQTIELVAKLRHARRAGISDHFEFLADGAYEGYARAIRTAYVARQLGIGEMLLFDAPAHRPCSA